jgi:uncharacterized protein
MQNKADRLNRFFAENRRLALAFSGGVDSAYLLYAAVRAGCDVRPYYVKTAFQPEFEFADAKRLANELGVEMHVIEKDILSKESVRSNPSNRCYFCKRALFTEIIAAAQRDGYSLLVDGTNASDDADDRPGMRALRELEVRSPLREAGLTKDEIRALSREAGLFTWDKPAYACLATRIPTGTEIDKDTLARIERSEDALRAMGFSDLRVRVMSASAKLQLPEAQFALAVQKRSEILNALAGDFDAVLLDMKAR